MARIKPDADDIDGQGDGPVIENGGNNVPENADGGIDPTKLVGGYGDETDGDNFARNPDGSIKRNKDGSPQRKRGRKSGSGGGNSYKTASGGNKALKDSIDSLASIIGIVHLGLSSVSKCPELKLDASESDALAKATANVLAQFDVTPDPKITAIVGLVTTAGTIYGPRAFLIKTRKSEEKEAKKNGVDYGNVLAMNGGVSVK